MIRRRDGCGSRPKQFTESSVDARDHIGLERLHLVAMLRMGMRRS